MNMEFFRKLPIPKEIKAEFPVTEKNVQKREICIAEQKEILSGNSQKFLLLIGPCSADSEKSVLDYLNRLWKVQEKVKNQILILPRIFTNKPRTTGQGYKGMLHQPDPNAAPDLLKGLIATRQLHLNVLTETDFGGCADEMLYPENHRYLSDVLAYVTVGARSVENQQHRMTASGLEIPVGMKNPTGGDLSVLLNSISAAHQSHDFLYRGWEVKSKGNPYAHAVLRGYINLQGKPVSNYEYENLVHFSELYEQSGLSNPAVIVDTNHANSGKDEQAQIKIAMDVLSSRQQSSQLQKMVKGLMIESYIEDGCQSIGDSAIYGKSITDPCLGWKKTERLIYEIAERI